MDNDEIVKYWIEPDALFKAKDADYQMTGSTPLILMGGRGTGKTMVLKYLSNEIQIRKVISERGDKRNYIADISFFGVYYRFDGPSLSSFQKRHVDEIQWETLFKHYFELLIGQKYITMILNLKENSFIRCDQNTEGKLAQELAMWLYNQPDVSSLELLVQMMQKQVDEVFEFINEAPFTLEPIFKSRPIISTEKIIFDMPVILQKYIPELKGKKILILLDEYENLLEQQQRVINTLIKHIRGPVTFRVGTRIKGFKTMDTLNEGEYLLVDADYREILFEDVLLAKGAEYRNLLKNIANKRLESNPEFLKHGLTDIEKIFGELTPLEEALNVIYDSKQRVELNDIDFSEYKKLKHIEEITKILTERYNLTGEENDKVLSSLRYSQDPLIEMLNLLLMRREEPIENILIMFKAFREQKSEDLLYDKYKNLYEKNKLALLFQLLSIYRPKQKQYAGFGVLAMLSSGVTRNFLELCYQSFKFALFLGEDELIQKGQIPFATQTTASKHRAEKFLKSIETIPNYGNQIKSLVTSLGAIFASWHYDPRLREPEITYFITDKQSLSEDGRKVLDAAVQWSIFQEKKQMRGKSSTDPMLDVYVLNHLLAPYFSISYRIRGRTAPFNAKDLETLMFGNDTEKKMLINKLERGIIPDTEQSNLSHFIGGEK